MFWFHFAVLKECDTFGLNSVSFFPSCSLQPINSYFASLKAILEKDLQTMLHPSMNYWFQYTNLHQALLKSQRPAEESLKFRAHVPLSANLHQVKIYFFFFFFFFLIIFFALIDDPNNFEINRLIRSVVNGVFLLP